MRYEKLDMILHFLFMHLLDKLFGVRCISQGLLLSYIMAVSVGWAMLRLVME